MKQILLLFIFILSSFFGFSQNKDSVEIILPRKFTWKQTEVPLALIITGVVLNGNGKGSIKNELVDFRNRKIPNFKTKIDNYLQISPIVIAYGLDAVGVKSKTDFLNRSVILLKSEVLMLSLVTALKFSTHILRPDGSSYTSFPSGHTAQAFVGATFLNEEYGQRFKWMPWLSYGLASTVGILRMANDKHYISDVLVASGIGILSTKVAYWTHRYKWGRRNMNNYSLQL